MAITTFAKYMYEEKYHTRFNYEDPSGKEHSFLWSDIRVDRSTLPAGWYAYDVRGNDDDGYPCTIENNYVYVNHCGTILSQEPLYFPDGKSWIELDEENWSFE